MSCLVSVIMPVYNSFSYLKDAVDTVLAEKSEEFELILVDDGSTDGSSSLCDEIEQTDRRVRVFHKQNGGMCQARNIGIANARGKWVAFMDNDDMILPGFIDENLIIAQEYECDCLVFGRKWVQIDTFGSTQFSIEEAPEKKECLYGKAVLGSYFKCTSVSDGVWVRFYKRSMLTEHGIAFDESFRSGFEDSLFNDLVIEHAQSYAFNPKCYYVWFRRESHSTSMQTSENRLTSLSKTLEHEYRILKDRGMLEKEKNKCASLFFSRILDILVANHLTGDCSYAVQLPIYKALFNIAKPYSDLLAKGSLRLDRNIAKRLFISRRFKALYIYLKAGSRIKVMLKNNS